MSDEPVRDQIARLLFKEIAIARGHGPDQWHELWTNARESVQDQIEHAYRLADQILALVGAPGTADPPRA